MLLYCFRLADHAVGDVLSISVSKYYDSLNITALYDEVITDLHADYPRDRISSAFWASPKIWAMAKLQTPFVIFDTDLVPHKPLGHYADCDLLYLHRETSAIYPNIFDIQGPPGFAWDDDMVPSFRESQPMNCAVVGMFNEAFARDYARRYFDFVLDAPGEVLFATADSHKMNRPGAAQIVAEQWLLAAVAQHWKNFKSSPLKTRAVCKAIWTHGLCFSPFDMDLGGDAVAAEVASTFYHLWGAKAVQNFSDQREAHRREESPLRPRQGTLRDPCCGFTHVRQGRRLEVASATQPLSFRVPGVPKKKVCDTGQRARPAFAHRGQEHISRSV